MGKLVKISRHYLAALTVLAIMPITGCGQQSVSTDMKPTEQAQPVSHQSILVKKKTDDHFWTPRETPVLSDFPNLATLPEDQLSQYGGWIGKSFQASGFFRTEKQDGVWWLVDPDGYAFFSIGLNTVLPGVEATSDEKILKDRFFGANSSIKNWADKTGAWLGETGFNTLGSWSDWRTLNDGKRTPVPYTEQLHLLSRFVGRHKKAKLNEGEKLHWLLYYIFDEEFPAYCAKYMQDIAKRTKDDPYLIGYFTDNELGHRVNQLERILKLPVSDSVRQKVVDWLAKERGVKVNPDGSYTLSQDDRMAFYAYHVQTYYKVVSKAVRDADPNHMIIGDRLNYDQQDNPLIWEVSARYLDVLSYNWYHVWNPDENNDIGNWAHWSDKPVMITEWYAKGLDSGMKNDTGAGWIVATQEERGKFYETFALGLLNDPSVVGFHWFQYRDNNVDAAHLVDWTNRDSNKGMVNVDYQPYRPLESRARKMNKRVYGIRAEILEKHGE